MDGSEGAVVAYIHVYNVCIILLVFRMNDDYYRERAMKEWEGKWEVENKNYVHKIDMNFSISSIDDLQFRSIWLYFVFFSVLHSFVCFTCSRCITEPFRRTF